MMKHIINSFRQVQKHEDVQDALGTMFLGCMFGIAVIASTGQLFQYKSRPKSNGQETAHLHEINYMVIVSADALERIKQKVEKKQVWGLRLGMRPNGCNGWSYDLSYLEEPNVSSDAVFYGIIAVDPMTFSYVDQISIDWIEDGLNESFEIKSPQETARCGCGESFTI